MRGSLAIRGLLALGLLVGFYGLAGFVVLGLVYVPYAEVTYFHRLDFKLAAFCLMGAGAVLWAVLPRPDRFLPPGPELLAADHPELFKLLDSVREATGEAAPANVYLVLDVNAWVAQRGGFMGFGSRRVMGLGLPLLQALSVEQLRGVVAHEFGHYAAGDTMLGPWIHRTRVGIGRTLATLESSWIRLPFVAFARMFFRVTNAVSRQQELAADALAARVVSPQAVVEGLQQVHRAAVAFGPFWQSDYAPALSCQARLPLAEGFSRFLLQPQIATSLEAALQQALDDRHTDPYDSHPALADRCEALTPFETRSDTDTRPAVALLNDVPRLETALLRRLLESRAEDLRPVTWADAPGLVWYPAYQRQVLGQAKALGGASIAQAARLCVAPRSVARLLEVPSGYLPGLEERQEEVRALVARGLIVALVEAGWELRADPGGRFRCTHGDQVVEPFVLVHKWTSGELVPETWEEESERLGIADLRLVPAVSTAGTARAAS